MLFPSLDEPLSSLRWHWHLPPSNDRWRPKVFPRSPPLPIQQISSAEPVSQTSHPGVFKDCKSSKERNLTVPFLTFIDVIVGFDVYWFVMIDQSDGNWLEDIWNISKIWTRSSQGDYHLLLLGFCRASVKTSWTKTSSWNAKGAMKLWGNMLSCRKRGTSNCVANMWVRKA